MESPATRGSGSDHSTAPARRNYRLPQELPPHTLVRYHMALGMNRECQRERVRPLRRASDDVQSPPALTERWFRALDQRRIDGETREWVAQVLGIYPVGQEIWIQIAPTDASDQTYVLHVSQWTTVDQAIAALQARCCREDDAYPRMISVIPTL